MGQRVPSFVCFLRNGSITRPCWLIKERTFQYRPHSKDNEKREGRWLVNSKKCDSWIADSWGTGDEVAK
jgi:hypothetical protein